MRLAQPQPAPQTACWLRPPGQLLRKKPRPGGQGFLRPGVRHGTARASQVLGRLVIFDPVTYPGSPIIKHLARPLPHHPHAASQ